MAQAQGKSPSTGTKSVAKYSLVRISQVSAKKRNPGWTPPVPRTPEDDFWFDGTATRAPSGWKITYDADQDEVPFIPADDVPERVTPKSGGTKFYFCPCKRNGACLDFSRKLEQLRHSDDGEIIFL
jgi:hypothetical protein